MADHGRRVRHAPNHSATIVRSLFQGLQACAGSDGNKDFAGKKLLVEALYDILYLIGLDPKDQNRTLAHKIIGVRSSLNSHFKQRIESFHGSCPANKAVLSRSSQPLEDGAAHIAATKNTHTKLCHFCPPL